MPKLLEMCPQDLRAAREKNLPLFIPVGTVEYHGSQLPLGTDLYISKGIVDEISKKVDIVVAPPFVYSPGGYAVSGPEKGTVDISVDCFSQHCYEILKAYRQMGFERIYVIVHHQPENIMIMLKNVFLKLSMYEVSEEIGNGWWTDGKSTPHRCSFITEKATLDTGCFGGHGGKGETEAIMALYPQLVRKDLLSENEPFWNETVIDANEENAKRELDIVINKWIEKLK
ncbi:MAG: creatininase family protein [bacterium]|nr:creatininase family protein [bacterium]